jgi:hypothetical protein
VILVEGQKGEAVGVIEIALPAGEGEEQDRAGDQGQAHEHLQGQDLHNGLLALRENVVRRIVVRELAGMNTAQTSGDITPAYASETASTL